MAQIARQKNKLVSERAGHSNEDAESFIRKHYLTDHEAIDAIGRRTKVERNFRTLL